MFGKIPRLSALNNVKRESRYGIVIVLSFTLILSGMVWKKWMGPKSAGTGLVNEIPNASGSKEKDKSEKKATVAANDKGGSKDKPADAKEAKSSAGAAPETTPPVPSTAEKVVEAKAGDSGAPAKDSAPKPADPPKNAGDASKEIKVAETVPPTVPPAADASATLSELPPLTDPSTAGQSLTDASKDAPPRPKNGAASTEVVSNSDPKPPAQASGASGSSNEPIITPLPAAGSTPPASASPPATVAQEDPLPASPPGEIAATNLPPVDTPSGANSPAPLPPVGDLPPAGSAIADAERPKPQNSTLPEPTKTAAPTAPAAASGTPDPAPLPVATGTPATTTPTQPADAALSASGPAAASSLPTAATDTARNATAAAVGAAGAVIAAEAMTSNSKPGEARTRTAPTPTTEDGWVALPTIKRKPESPMAASANLKPIDPPTRRVEPAEPVGAGVVTPVAHVVQRNENFFTISRSYYGTGKYYMALWAANRQKVSAVDQLYVGTTIIIPPEEALDRSLIQPPKRSQVGRSAAPSRPRRNTSMRGGDRSEVLVDLPTSGRAGEDSQADDPVSMRTARQIRADLPYHSVRANETLRSIARARLDDSHRAKEIEELNADVIRYDADGKLIPGQMLRLPQDARPLRGE